MDLIRAKSATLSRNQTALKKKSLDRCKTIESANTRLRSHMKFRHQQAYSQSLTLSLFEQKWQILQEKNNQLNTGGKSKITSYFEQFKSLKSRASNGSDNLRLLVQIFWTAICLLESDYEHEFLLSIEIISQILNKIDLSTGVASNGQLLVHKNEFRTHLELFAFRINWPGYPGLQNLLIKGCTCSSSNAIETTQRLLIQLIPHCSKLNFVDPHGDECNGLAGISMNLLALLPTMIYNYEQPTELCIGAAQLYYKVLCEKVSLVEQQQRGSKPQEPDRHSRIQRSTKLEHLKNLAHVMNLYSTGNFGKDRAQWTKCVITYLSEYFQQCQCDETACTSFYFKWIVFLTELLDKSSNNPQFQSCVFICLNSLISFISFNEPKTWAFINEELMHIIVKYLNTSLWSEALELIKLTVNKSSSLIGLTSTGNTGINLANNPKFFLSSSTDLSTNLSVSQQIPSTSFFNKKELPGRTLEFDFDFSLFVPAQLNNNLLVSGIFKSIFLYFISVSYFIF